MWVDGRWHLMSTPGGSAIHDRDYFWHDDFQGDPGMPTVGSFPMMAFGGTDLQRSLGRITALGTGTTAVTGLGFEPDVVLLMTNRDHNAIRDIVAGWDIFDPTTGTYPDAELYWGAADRFGNQWCGGFWTLWYYAWIRHGYWNEGCALGVGDPTGFSSHTQVPAQATVAMDADGFTLTHDAGLDGWTNVYYLALRSPSLGMKVGTFVQPSSTGDQDITGLGFDPGAVWLSSAQQTAAQDAWHDDVRIQHGLICADGQENAATAWRYQGGDRSTARTIHASNACAWSRDQTGDLAKAFGTLITDGFRLNWSIADAEARRFGYVAFETDEIYDYLTPPLANLHFNTAITRHTNVGTKACVSLGFGVSPSNGVSVGGYIDAGDYSNAHSVLHAIDLPQTTISASRADLYVEGTELLIMLQQIYRRYRS